MDEMDLEKFRHRKTTEEIRMSRIQHEGHNDDNYRNAKQDELSRFEDLGAFRVVDDSGQDRISWKWILWMKGYEARARLCTQDFEET